MIQSPEPPRIQPQTLTLHTPFLQFFRGRLGLRRQQCSGQLCNGLLDAVHACCQVFCVTFGGGLQRRAGRELGVVKCHNGFDRRHQKLACWEFPERRRRHIVRDHKVLLALRFAETRPHPDGLPLQRSGPVGETHSSNLCCEHL